MGVVAIIAGSAFGLVGALPSAFLLERALRGSEVTLNAGLASVATSFLAETVVLLVCACTAASSLFQFGCAMVITYLAVWVIEAMRALWLLSSKRVGSEGSDITWAIR